MPADLANRINAYLLTHPRFVPTHELCQVFQINERKLRSSDGKPGLLDAFAISTDEGYKHIFHATVMDKIRAKNRIKRHWIAERRKELRLEEAWRRWRTNNPVPMELKTGQLLIKI